MTIKEILEKIVGQLDEFVRETLAGLLSHFITTSIEGEGENKKVTKTLNVEAVRAHAPFFVQTLADEAEFQGLVMKLGVGLQKNLEEKMGPGLIPLHGVGPVLPPIIGKHQRSDIVLTIVNMNEREGFSGVAAARVEAIEALQQLAAIDNDAKWIRRAVAFKLMKADESEYLGAYLTVQTQMAFRQLVQEFFLAKAQYDVWANTRADQLDVWTDRMRQNLRIRPTGFFATLRRMWDLPHESTW